MIWAVAVETTKTGQASRCHPWMLTKSSPASRVFSAQKSTYPTPTTFQRRSAILHRTAKTSSEPWSPSSGISIATTTHLPSNCEMPVTSSRSVKSHPSNGCHSWLRWTPSSRKPSAAPPPSYRRPPANSLHSKYGCGEEWRSIARGPQKRSRISFLFFGLMRPRNH